MTSFVRSDEPPIFPMRITVGSAPGATATLHADGRVTGGDATAWAAALATARGRDYTGVYATAWLILRELQRQEAA
jgi:hypothetical protein